MRPGNRGCGEMNNYGRNVIKLRESVHTVRELLLGMASRRGAPLSHEQIAILCESLVVLLDVITEDIELW